VRALVAALLKVGSVVTVTGSLKEQLIGLGVPAGKIHVAHDAVDLATFDLQASKVEARRKLGLPEVGRVASFVGKFHTNGMEKGIPEILSSSKYLLGEFPDLHFFFVGGPMDRVPGYREILRKDGLPVERFVFIDKQTVSLVPWYLKASDVLLMPHPWSTFYAYHVSPLKLFEYMSAKRPIVASKLPAIMEILSDESNALLGGAGSFRELPANIRKALLDPALSERIADKAFSDVQEHTWKKRAERIIGFVVGDGVRVFDSAPHRELAV